MIDMKRYRAGLRGRSIRSIAQNTRDILLSVKREKIEKKNDRRPTETKHKPKLDLKM